MRERATVLCWQRNKILLVAKTSAKWTFPGGKPNQDEAIVDAAIREIFEETQLVIEPPKFLCVFSENNTAHHVFEIRLAESVVATASNEIKLIAWVPPRQLSAMSLSRSTKAIVEYPPVSFRFTE
jgi:8-oxo-dGTP diphosphatase